jgi:tripartite-type tricarboxylate transporter receptor subunit TctC
MEVFKSATGINVVHVPYKGTAGAVQDCWADRST